MLHRFAKMSGPCKNTATFNGKAPVGSTAGPLGVHPAAS